MLGADEIASLVAGVAAANSRDGVFGAIERIASVRMKITVFSVSTCNVAAMELERIYSSRPDVYPVGIRKSKRETGWGKQVLKERRVFVGEGPLEMAAAFDDQERMASLGRALDHQCSGGRRRAVPGGSSTSPAASSECCLQTYRSRG